tara:strand:- start:14 stop:454 length:441 start_codon:yes stop_codon:yes gene_type:complete
MNQVTVRTTRDGVEKVIRLEQQLAALPQVPIDTFHLFHEGMYARTIMIPAGTALTGAHITIPTLLVINGHVNVTIGDQATNVCGYQVLPAEANRKTAYLAIEDTWVTMIFPSDAVTIEDAENQFTDEADRLMSRSNNNLILNKETT